MRRLEAGETFIVTRGESPMGELGPDRRQRFVSSHFVADIFHGAPRIDLKTNASRSRDSRRPRLRAPCLNNALPGNPDTSVVIDLGSSIQFYSRLRWRSPLSPWPSWRQVRTLQKIRRKGHDVRTDCNGRGSIRCLPFDSAAARAYGVIYAAVTKRTQGSRHRAVDLLIAAVAAASGHPHHAQSAGPRLDSKISSL